MVSCFGGFGGGGLPVAMSDLQKGHFSIVIQISLPQFAQVWGMVVMIYGIAAVWLSAATKKGWERTPALDSAMVILVL